jgi:hypothetical protein
MEFGWDGNNKEKKNAKNCWGIKRLFSILFFFYSNHCVNFICIYVRATLSLV